MAALLLGSATVAAWQQPGKSSDQPQRIPRQSPRRDSTVQGIVRDSAGQPLAGAQVKARNLVTNKSYQAGTQGDGVFRLLHLPPGPYALTVEKEGFLPGTAAQLQLRPSEVSMLPLVLDPAQPPLPMMKGPAVPRRPESLPSAPAEPSAGPATAGPYRELPRRPKPKPELTAELPSAGEVFTPQPDRWDIPMPEWRRYGKKGEYPYVVGHIWDPFNRNKAKGDYPVKGQQLFFGFTGASDTLLIGRRLYVPSGVSAQQPGSTRFFGRGGQGFISQNFRFAFDLFHGDTSFRPIDWRVRVTPAVNINYLHARERGIVNLDVREGISRTDAHLGLQEGFFEARLRDLSPNFDFVSLRAGIQQFTSDFRGFVFSEEQPGLRIFGNLRSDKWEYNLAYFNFLEKDTNSGLNTLQLRDQQVLVANFYVQDFIKAGYNTQISFHYNKDDGTLHFDENHFLVRPQPIGAVKPHDVRAYYLGWTGNGHFGRVNISHAFYQALGHDQLNPIAGRRVDINAQMAALELSLDKDWMRFRGSFFYASGDDNPRGRTARGFDAIVDAPAFAGRIFSFWNREGIRLTGTGVGLVQPNSLLPSLRSSKEEGQANFVNPGLLLFNLGADFDLTPKLRSFVNANFLRFDKTEPLELLLFQSPVRPGIGGDYGLGFQYRPPLTENIILTTGASALTPWQGLRDIYQGKTIFSVFAVLHLQF